MYISETINQRPSGYQPDLERISTPHRQLPAIGRPLPAISTNVLATTTSECDRTDGYLRRTDELPGTKVLIGEQAPEIGYDGVATGQGRSKRVGPVRVGNDDTWSTSASRLRKASCSVRSVCSMAVAP